MALKVAKSSLIATSSSLEISTRFTRLGSSFSISFSTGSSLARSSSWQVIFLGKEVGFKMRRELVGGLEGNHSRKKQCGEMCVLDIIVHCKVSTGVCVPAVTISLRWWWRDYPQSNVYPHVFWTAASVNLTCSAGQCVGKTRQRGNWPSSRRRSRV